jgi:NADPH2:quinone reductase
MITIVNPHDQKVRDIGLFLDGKLPAIIADDIAGTVEKVGPDAKGFKIGDRLFGQASVFDHDDAGGLQQYAILEAYASTKTPSIISDDQAATFPANSIAAIVALFHSDGLGIPAPFIQLADGSHGAPLSSEKRQLVIIGGGSNTGKFFIQFAALAGFKDIIVVAGKGNEEELKAYGATHIIDRKASEETIKAHVAAITGDNCVYVCDTINTEYTLGLSLLSSTKRGKVVTLLRGGFDESKIGEKKEGYEINQILGSSHLKRELCSPFWKELPSLIESGKIKPLSFQVVKNGLDADNVNKVLDDYKDGKNPGKWHVHPNS